MIPFIHYDLCVGCKACVELFPRLFEMRDEKAWLINHETFNPEDTERIIASCPFNAITIE